MSSDVDPSSTTLKGGGEDEGRYRGLDIDTDDDSSETKAMNRDEGSISYDDEIKALKKTVTEQANVIEKLKTELKNSVDASNANNESKKRKRDASEVLDIAMVADSFNKDQLIRELKKEIETLKSQLRNGSTTPAKTVADKYTEPKPARALPANPPLPNITTLFQELQNGVEQKINDMKVSIEASMEKKIARAFGSSNSIGTTYAAATRTTTTDGKEASSFPTTNQGNDFRTIMADTKNEELLTENDRQRRAANIIIHGVKERSKHPESRMEELDKNYISALFAVLGLQISANSVTRLGKFNPEGKCRPLKLVMGSIEDKLAVMSRLSNLKTAEEQYKNISVKDDYTPSERELIKHKHMQAKEMNERDNTTEWKVRGTPKNGLRIVKIKTRSVIQEPSTSHQEATQLN